MALRFTLLRSIRHQFNLSSAQGKGRSHDFKPPGFHRFRKDRTGASEPGCDVLHVGSDRVLQRVARLAFSFGHGGSNGLHDARDMAGFFGIGHRCRNRAAMLMT